MNKHFESLVGAVLFGGALFCLFFVSPMRFSIDPMHFTVIDLHVLPIVFGALGLYVTFGLLGAYPDMRVPHFALIALAIAVPIVMWAIRIHNSTWKLF